MVIMFNNIMVRLSNGLDFVIRKRFYSKFILDNEI